MSYEGASGLYYKKSLLREIREGIGKEKLERLLVTM